MVDVVVVVSGELGQLEAGSSYDGRHESGEVVDVMVTGHVW